MTCDFIMADAKDELIAAMQAKASECSCTLALPSNTADMCGDGTGLLTELDAALNAMVLSCDLTPTVLGPGSVPDCVTQAWMEQKLAYVLGLECKTIDLPEDCDVDRSISYSNGAGVPERFAGVKYFDHGLLFEPGIEYTVTWKSGHIRWRYYYGGFGHVGISHTNQWGQERGMYVVYHTPSGEPIRTTETIGDNRLYKYQSDFVSDISNGVITRSVTLQFTEPSYIGIELPVQDPQSVESAFGTVNFKITPCPSRCDFERVTNVAHTFLDGFLSHISWDTNGCADFYRVYARKIPLPFDCSYCDRESLGDGDLKAEGVLGDLKSVNLPAFEADKHHCVRVDAIKQYELTGDGLEGTIVLEGDPVCVDAVCTTTDPVITNLVPLNPASGDPTRGGMSIPVNLDVINASRVMLYVQRNPGDAFNLHVVKTLDYDEDNTINVSLNSVARYYGANHTEMWRIVADNRCRTITLGDFAYTHIYDPGSPGDIPPGPLDCASCVEFFGHPKDPIVTPAGRSFRYFQFRGQTGRTYYLNVYKGQGYRLEVESEQFGINEFVTGTRKTFTLNVANGAVFSEKFAFNWRVIGTRDTSKPVYEARLSCNQIWRTSGEGCP